MKTQPCLQQQILYILVINFPLSHIIWKHILLNQIIQNIEVLITKLVRCDEIQLWLLQKVLMHFSFCRYLFQENTLSKQNITDSEHLIYYQNVTITVSNGTQTISLVWFLVRNCNYNC